MAITVTAPEIREGVRRMFNRVAATPVDKYRFAVGPSLARAVGYAEDVLASLPASAFDSFTGLAYLHRYLGLTPGQHVLDLGSGGGMDSVLAGRVVGPGGSVVGLDLSDEMVTEREGWPPPPEPTTCASSGVRPRRCHSLMRRSMLPTRMACSTSALTSPPWYRNSGES
jgi:hypothetical protein